MGQGDIVNQNSWQDQNATVPPSQFNKIPTGILAPGQSGDGRYWWTGNANSPPPPSTATILLHLDGINGSTVFTDSAVSPHAFTSAGAAAISTAQTRFGTGSVAAVIGAGNNVTTPNAADIVAALAGDFTVVAWYYLNGNTSGVLLQKVGFTSIYQFQMGFAANAFPNANGADGAGATVYSLVSSVQPTPNAWHMLALVRKGSSFKLFLDGQVVASSTYAGVLGNNAIANFTVVPGGIDGYVDEVALFPTALYTANFTPPVAPFTPTVISEYIQFIGDPADFTGNWTITWQELKLSNDGSVPVITYSTNGTTFTNVPLPVNSQGLQSGAFNIPLAGATQLKVGMFYSGGTVSPTATNSVIAFSVSRNNNESPAYNYPDPFNPAYYNAQRLDSAAQPVQTLLQLQTRLMYRLGFAAQASNPPPSMALLLKDFLFGAQKTLFKRYQALDTQRFFRWRVIPGQRFYSLRDNDDDVLSLFKMDPTKSIEWVGIQDNRNVWYPLIEGIPPELYTMIDKPWRPARYDIRQAIELYPAPDQTYWLWMKANFGLLSFAVDADQATLDSELVFLVALANAKSHYGHPDAGSVANQSETYLKQLVAASHKTARYIPGTRVVPPAIQPVMRSFLA